MKRFPECFFNRYIDCPNCGQCKSCGWNPEIERVRKVANRKKYGCCVRVGEHS